MGRLKAFIVAVVVTLASPAAAQDIACHDPLKPMLRAELFFGRNIGGRQNVSDREWARFLANELTPRFPEGLTVIDGRGQWRHAGTGDVVREPSKIVVIVTPDAALVRARIAAVAEAYKHHFAQESVGIVLQPVCAAL